MKHKRIFATALCGIMLLAGCGESAGDSADSQNVSADVSSVESSLSTVESEPTPTDSSRESTTESSTSSSSATQKKVNVELRIFISNNNSITFNYNPKDENGDYIDFRQFDKALLYEYDYPDSPSGTVIIEKKLYKGEDAFNENFITIRRPETTKYYRVKYVGKNGESKRSNAQRVTGYQDQNRNRY